MIQTDNKKVNIRTIPLELKTRDIESGGTEISGYALKFGVPSQDMGFIEFISQGALDGVDLSETMLLYNHDFGNILARADAGNLTLKVDQTGLLFDAQLPNTTLANDVVADIQAGNLKGCSFGFTLPDDCSGDDWTEDEQGSLIHTINQLATVAEVSITAIPAYTQTSVAVQRSLENYKKGIVERRMTEKENSKTILDAVKGLQEQVRALRRDDTDTDPDDDQNSIDSSTDDGAAFKVGDVVTVEANHMPGMQGSIGKIVGVAPDDTNTFEIDYWPTDGGDEVQNHKWVIGAELKPYSGVFPTTNPSADSSDDDDSDETSSRSQTEKNTIPENNKKGDKRNMPKDITPKNPEQNKKDEAFRNLEKYLRTGKRDADTTGGFSEGTDGGAVIPVDVLNVLAQPNDPSLLSGYVNKVQVASPTGKLPVLARATAVMASAAELADNPAIANATITPVTYDVTTLRGALPISMEMVQDYPNITSLLQDYVGTIKDRTEQRKIGAVLQQATAAAAKSIDDIKGIYNGNDLVWYTNKVIVVTASGYDWLDTQKDDNGRYLLQDSIAAATGKTLFGAPVIEVADDVLGAVGDKKMFIGDLKSFVLEAVKSNLSVAWTRNEQFEQILGIILRADFKVADSAAGKFITVSSTSTASQG